MKCLLQNCSGKNHGHKLMKLFFMKQQSGQEKEEGKEEEKKKS